MHHRHLLPNEIDLLLDEETGFGVQPLREHAGSCADCRARLSEAREITAALAALPSLAPRFGLADRVMTHVPVFVPWHVAARDSVLRWMPAGRVPRLAAAAVLATAGSVVTALTLWIVMRGDLLALVTGLVGEGARATVSRVIGETVVALFGPQVLVAVEQAGPLGVALAGGGFVIAGLATVFGLRQLATTGRPRS